MFKLFINNSFFKGTSLYPHSEERGFMDEIHKIGAKYQKLWITSPNC